MLLPAKTMKLSNLKHIQFIFLTLAMMMGSFLIYNNCIAMHPQVYTAEIQSLSNSKERVNLVIAVLSGPDQVDRRRHMREHWVDTARAWKSKYFTIKVFFYIGKFGNELKQTDLLAESARHNDLEFYDGTDTYDGLTNKTLSLLVFVNNNFDFDHFMKVDSDVPLDIEKITMEVRGLPKYYVFWGNLNRGAIIPEKGQRWHDHIFIRRMGHKRLSPYMLGPAYILSADLVAFIAYVETNIGLTQFVLEDASVGHWLSVLKDVNYINPKYYPKFVNKHDEQGLT